MCPNFRPDLCPRPQDTVQSRRCGAEATETEVIHDSRGRWIRFTFVCWQMSTGGGHALDHLHCSYYFVASGLALRCNSQCRLNAVPVGPSNEAPDKRAGRDPASGRALDPVASQQPYFNDLCQAHVGDQREHKNWPVQPASCQFFDAFTSSGMTRVPRRTMCDRSSTFDPAYHLCMDSIVFFRVRSTLRRRNCRVRSLDRLP